MCIRCKLPPWIGKDCFCFLQNHPKSVMHVRSILWFDRLIISIPYVFPSTPSHWLICSRRRSFFFRVRPMQGLRYPRWWFHLNSIVCYYKTTTWSCSSWIACSQGCSRTSSCFGACYRSSFPKNLATSSRRFVLQTFFSRNDVWNIMLPTRSKSQADRMVGTFPAFAFCSQLAPPLCQLPMGCPSQ